MAKAQENNEQLTAKDLEIADLQEKLQRSETLLKQQASNPQAVQIEALKHPTAFRAQDGRILYKTEIDGQTVVSTKPLEEMTVEELAEGMPIAMFQGQANRLPQNLTVKFKDPQWAGFWFNKKARNGYRVHDARSKGWEPAKIEDLESYFCGLNDKDGALEDYDLVLMKIHKVKLYMKLAEAINDAKFKGGVEGYRQRATAAVNGGQSKQVAFYATPQALNEIQGLGRAVDEL